MKLWPLSDRASTVVTVIVGLALFFHPHFGPLPITPAVDCTGRVGRDRVVPLAPASRRQLVWAKLCDTLVLVNISGQPLYPAPGPHPHHDSFPELDIKRNLLPGERVAIPLVRTGNYQLHNHDTEKILVDLTVFGQAK